jgi:hypothetical protein
LKLPERPWAVLPCAWMLRQDGPPCKSTGESG